LHSNSSKTNFLFTNFNPNARGYDVRKGQNQTSMANNLADFDWDKVSSNKGFGLSYSATEREKLENLINGTLSEVAEKEVVKGTVVGITDREVILNIGSKSDGLVPLSEFRDLPDMKIGDEVEVYIENQEDASGQLVLSRKKAKVITAWDNIQKSHEGDVIIDGFVKRRTKGGLIVDIYGIEAFLPGSQIDVKPIRDFDVYVNKKMEVKVVKINHANNNVVVSHKILIEKDLEAQRQTILTNLEKGQVLEGVIKNMTKFGVFIDLGGVDGLLHITDISWGRITDPSDVLSLDQKVNIVVLDFDEEKKRISLGMKQLQAHPWELLDAGIEVGSKIKGVEGLVHVSEMSWSQHLRNPQEFLKVGQEIEAMVLTLERTDRKMSLGIKQLSSDPWTRQDLLGKYSVGTKHTGLVRNLTNFGLFLELEEGIDGLVHVSDLSWTKKIKHPGDFVKVGEQLEVQVLELDIENRRLSLSHKHLEENPWVTFEDIFSIGSSHKCTMTAKNEKVATLELPYGIEGISFLKSLAKEDGTNVEVGESADFKVIEFSRDEKRIVLSHVKTWQETVEPVKEENKKQPKAEKASNNKDNEKSTLGDLSSLSALKEQMEEGEKKKKAATKKAAAPKVEKAADEVAVATEEAMAETTAATPVAEVAATEVVEAVTETAAATVAAE
jgi:small subunit ribosomal protein S1